MEKKFLPRHTHRQTTGRVLPGVVVVLQVVSLIFGFVYYNTWYSISNMGASAVASSLLCGFSQGLLQLIVYHRFHVSNLLKFYCWGVINGFWTVSKK